MKNDENLLQYKKDLETACRGAYYFLHFDYPEGITREELIELADFYVSKNKMFTYNKAGVLINSYQALWVLELCDKEFVTYKDLSVGIRKRYIKKFNEIECPVYEIPLAKYKKIKAEQLKNQENIQEQENDEEQEKFTDVTDEYYRY